MNPFLPPPLPPKDRVIPISSDTQSAYSYINEAKSALNNQLYDKALEILTTGITEYPFEPSLYCERSSVYTQFFHHYHLATDDANMAISLDSNHYLGYLRKARALLGLMRHFESLTQIEIALNMAPQSEVPAILTLYEYIKAIPISTRLYNTIHTQGKKILCLDGGGMRGLAMVEMLSHIERHTGRHIHEMFDMVCGTSTGGLLAMAIFCKLDMEQCRDLYLRLGKQIFVKNKKNLPPWYDGNRLFEVIQQEFGNERLIDYPDRPKVFVVGSNTSKTPPTPHLFRNYSFAKGIPERYAGTYGTSLAEASRITASAPVYFESYSLNGTTFCDGAIVANNPSQIALEEARRLWGDVSIDVIVSLGTGISEKKPGITNNLLNQFKPFLGDLFGSVFDTVDFLKSMVSLITSSETTHQAMKSLASSSGIRYWRYNPQIEPVELDETETTKLNRLVNESRSYMEVHKTSIEKLSSILTGNKM